MIFSALRYPLTVRGDLLGSPLTLTVPTRGRSLTLRYRCGSREGVIAQETVDGEIQWTPPLSLAAEYPRDNRIPVTLVLEQYRKGQLAASRQERILLKLPEDITPQVVLGYGDAMGYWQTYGGFVQGKSRLTVSAQVSGTFGAGIARVELTCGALAGMGSPLTFDLPQAGRVTLTARVWDQRGRTASAAAEVTVLPYSSPVGEIVSIERGESWTVRIRGAVTELGGKNKGVFTLLLEKAGEETRRFPVEGMQAVIPAFDDSWGLSLEAADNFERVAVPYVPAPLLDVLRETKALGIGCRAEREKAVSLGLPLDLRGGHLENLAPPQEEGDAVPLGYARAHFLNTRLLWENPDPTQAFPAQTLEIGGGFLLIEAAVEAGGDAVFWEIGGDRCLLRAAEGVQRSVTREGTGLTFGTTAKGDSWAVPLRVYG